ncbi:hypothetical protein ACFQU2_28560 [Siccirubricoccus deserti]
MPGLAVYDGRFGDAIFLARVTALQPGDITFAPLPSNFLNLAANDLNADGYSDILLQHVTGGISRWSMNGAAVVDAPAYGVLNPGAEVIARVDLNGDAQDEVLWRLPDGTIGVWNLPGAVATGAVIAPGCRWPIRWSPPVISTATARTI